MFKVTKYFFSGMTRQDRYAVRRVPELVGTSGHMLIRFYSDVAYNIKVMLKPVMLYATSLEILISICPEVLTSSGTLRTAYRS